MPTHIGEGHLLGPPIQMPISSGNALKTHPEIMFNLGTVWPAKLIKLTITGEKPAADPRLVQSSGQVR